jgi:hypothetical protein
VESDPYLLDHIVEGFPVFPAAYHMGLMVRAAEAVAPSLSVLGLRNVRFEQPAWFRGGRPMVFTVSATPSPDAASVVSVRIDSAMPAQRPGLPEIMRTHALGEVLVGVASPRPGRFHVVDFAGAPPYSELYALPKEIQHGPAFLAGRAYRHVAPNVLFAEVAPPAGDGRGWATEATVERRGWPGALLNAVLHVGFSLAVLKRGKTVLPLRVESGELGPVPEGRVQVLARCTHEDGARLSFHVAAWGAHGERVGVFRAFTVQQVG